MTRRSGTVKSVRMHYSLVTPRMMVLVFSTFASEAVSDFVLCSKTLSSSSARRVLLLVGVAGERPFKTWNNMQINYTCKKESEHQNEIMFETLKLGVKSRIG